MPFTKLCDKAKRWRNRLKNADVKVILNEYLREMAVSNWPMDQWLLLDSIMYELSLCSHKSNLCQWYHELLKALCEVDPVAPIPLFFLRHYADYSLSAFFSSVLQIVPPYDSKLASNTHAGKSFHLNPSIHCVLHERINQVHLKLNSDPSDFTVGGEALDLSLFSKAEALLRKLNV
ncbi:hypothetical protein XU18_0456 [Perkinsela sp. CCAP 1560/4]|nr:hypothetical protein XU18_0456 [Perkinsela sp. CCAP 1560/4]|eukprot:KNH09771.1 hypothetical protein XU18_0456 [Perkinsela sp. CCAP 1560/4]